MTRSKDKSLHLKAGLAAIAMAGLLLLGGCSETQHAWSSITGDDADAAPAPRPAPVAKPAAAAPVAPRPRPAVAEAPPPPPAPWQHGAPLLTIRFDRRDVPFERALYVALNSALERDPGVHFTLVAVSPSAGSAAQVAAYAGEAKRNAGSVLHALVRMGLPANRVSIAATTSQRVRVGEVRIYVE